MKFTYISMALIGVQAINSIPSAHITEDQLNQMLAENNIDVIRKWFDEAFQERMFLDEQEEQIAKVTAEVNKDLADRKNEHAKIVGTLEEMIKTNKQVEIWLNGANNVPGFGDNSKPVDQTKGWQNGYIWNN